MALVSAFAEVLQRGDACTPTLPLCRDVAGRQAPVRPASAAMKGDNGKLNDVVPPELQPVQRRPRRSNWLGGDVHAAAGKVRARVTREVGIFGNVPWQRADVKVAMARTHRRARSSAPARSSPVALHTRCIRAPRVCPWARSIASSWRAFTPDETTGASSSLDSNVCYPKCTDPLTLRVHLPGCHSMQRHGKYASSSFRAAFFALDLSHAGMDL